jgi:hypothetical protein
MSWEAWGSGDDPIDADVLYRRGWESDPNCERWWKADDPDKIYTFDEAVEIYLDWVCNDGF